jgi:hypothetical protein
MGLWGWGRRRNYYLWVYGFGIRTSRWGGGREREREARPRPGPPSQAVDIVPHYSANKPPSLPGCVLNLQVEALSGYLRPQATTTSTVCVTELEKKNYEKKSAASSCSP